MAWFKVDDGFANSKPVLRIPRRYRAQAVGLWVMAGTWCAKELTDGYVPDYVLDDLASTPAVAQHLVRSGLWENADGGWQFVGWAKYQFTKEQVLTRRTEEAERKKKAREAKQKPVDQQELGGVPGMSHADTVRIPAGKSAESALPDQTRPDPNPSLVTYGGELTQASANEPPPCSQHGDENSHTPCGACRGRRLWLESREESAKLHQIEERRRLKELRDNCSRCQGTNTVEIRDGLVVKCDHGVMAHG